MLRRLVRTELVSTVKGAFPQLSDWDGTPLQADPVSSLGFDSNAQLVLASPSFVENWNRTAESIAAELTSGDAVAQLVTCDLGIECAREELDRLGPKLARRSFTDEEKDEFLSFWAMVEARADVESAWRWMLVAVLQHPSVIYRSEVGVPGEGEAWRLTGPEIADQIAYTFSGSPPDARLLDLSRSGELEDPEVRVAEARRLLETPQGQQQILRFLRQWLQTTGVRGVTRDVEGFSDVALAMSEEADRYLSEVVARGGGLEELLLSPYTFVNADLAAFYGWGGGDDWIEVDREPTQGVGVLALGAIVARFAQNSRSSPTQRGLLVYRRLLCTDVPEPPDGIPAVEATKGESKTTREIWEENHANEDLCRGCHAAFDPLGYAFEHFDHGGRYRSDENGLAIDASGSLVGMDGEVWFDGISELSHALVEEARTSDCMSGVFAHWAFGGAGGSNCLAEDARGAFSRGELSIEEFFAALAAAPHFTHREAMQ